MSCSLRLSDPAQSSGLLRDSAPPPVRDHPGQEPPQRAQVPSLAGAGPLS